MTGLDLHFLSQMGKKIMVSFPSSRERADVHRTSAVSSVRVLLQHKTKTRGRCLSFLFGADDRTRTCTLARWNLNPMSLPIPPHPHMNSRRNPSAIILFYTCAFAQLPISSALSFAWWPRTDRPSATSAPGQERIRSFTEFARPLPSLVQSGTIFLPVQS